MPLAVRTTLQQADDVASWNVAAIAVLILDRAAARSAAATLGSAKRWEPSAALASINADKPLKSAAFETVELQMHVRVAFHRDALQHNTRGRKSWSAG